MTDMDPGAAFSRVPRTGIQPRNLHVGHSLCPGPVNQLQLSMQVLGTQNKKVKTQRGARAGDLAFSVKAEQELSALACHWLNLFCVCPVTLRLA